MVRYRSCRPPDTALRERLRDLAVERRRFGYRRLFVLLRREGEPSGKNRIYRLYREEGLTVRKRRGRVAAPWERARRSWSRQGQRPLVPGLRARSARRRTPVPHPQRGRRRDPGVPGRDPRHLDLGPASGAGTDDADQAARPARHDRLATTARSSPRTAILAWAEDNSASPGITSRPASRRRMGS